jgi:hypothetical protein
MNRRDRRTLKSIERRARRAVDKLAADPRMPSPAARRLMAHATKLHAQAIKYGLTPDPD